MRCRGDGRLRVARPATPGGRGHRGSERRGPVAPQRRRRQRTPRRARRSRARSPGRLRPAGPRAGQRPGTTWPTRCPIGPDPLPPAHGALARIPCRPRVTGRWAESAREVQDRFSCPAIRARAPSKPGGRRRAQGPSDLGGVGQVTPRQAQAQRRPTGTVIRGRPGPCPRGHYPAREFVPASRHPPPALTRSGSGARRAFVRIRARTARCALSSAPRRAAVTRWQAAGVGER